MKIESLAIASLVLDPSNARKHATKNLEAIKGSLAKFGQQKPIVVGKGNVVIAGNGTLEAARALGWTEIDVVHTKLEGPEAIAFAIADNRTGELAEWDGGILSETLKSLQAMDFDLGSIGFDDKDLAKMIATPVVEGLTDPDEVPENVETRCKVGDLYILGGHRLLCGDSTNVQHVERLMGGEKADMVFTDPPYGIDFDDEANASKQIAHTGKVSKKFGKIKNDDKEFDAGFILSFFKKSQIFLWGANEYTASIPRGSWIVWDKKLEQQANVPYGDFELCWSNGKGWKMVRVPWGGFKNKEKGEDRLHPTQKPVALAQEFFDRWGKPDDLVADLFLGSGTTLIACEKTGRRCFGMEIDPHYCDVILARWEKFTGKVAELAPAGAPK